MSEARILKHLAHLVSQDSQNPPRGFSGEDALITYPVSVLEGAGFEVRVDDFGEGHINILATRGAPKLLFNCHLDTVPVGEGWTRPALELTVDDGLAFGRGVCDIKGAAACLLALAEDTGEGVGHDMAVLLTTDEEGAGSSCVQRYLASPVDGIEQVVVCEPTLCEAITEHRGFLSVKGVIQGEAGHSSEPRALHDNANHRLAQWLSAALTYTEALADANQASGFNVGLISGGTKSNVIAPEARLHYSARLAPGQSNEAFFDTVKNLGGAHAWAQWAIPFSGSPLPAAGQTSEAAMGFCEAVRATSEFKVGAPVAFWTEAALFSEAGLPVLVLGPGDIAQAHTTDEWVAIDELNRAYDLYRVMNNTAIPNVASG
jgi:acetylornithine deacetylase